jgi:hypothetical protein
MADAAKVVPELNARKKITGPDVSGNPTNQPLTAGPHLLPAKLAPPIMIGARMSFKTKVFMRL